ncbi:hypothetical protein SAMN04515674_101609 [Pseudarcicella hirudinis]|uniref:Contractile injection system tube protein N-terminal domain-containing protein n=1 Tax=Pseudarcicella hirudinis TaxID=1079859 RepID=A0A1I5N5T7_9BACT|nr:hypothetical protein [Pseudarcicella hirudinis]SFP16952.1 hypothetical protein SAMN04515674_101609 [Pseudarcicella hirudinis]
MNDSDSGKLEKMKVIGYKNAEMKEKVGELKAMMNPENYQLGYKIEYDDKQGSGTSSKQLKFKEIKPNELAFEFLFDSTGIIDDKARSDVWQEIWDFKKMLVDYEGSSHQPRFFELIWGKMIFKGRLMSLDITFKLFKPDGTPIRAIAKTSFLGSVEENLRVAKEDAQSPDLTHERQVISGDHLSWMSYKIYEDPRYYLQVARANGLTNFRKLQAGSKIYFPPFDRESR